MEGRFRLAPPTPQSDWVPRLRLVQRLERRFEVPVIVVAAPAGYGKTSALSLALHADDAGGVDLWVQCASSDGEPRVFAEAVMQAGGMTYTGRAPSAERLAGMLARFAPAQVCLVLDDVHRIAADAPTWELVEEFLGQLPRNAHVLFSGRTRPPLALARRQVVGAVEHLGVRDLEFDDAELAARGSGSDAGDAARWPAVSALSRSTSPAGPVDFLVEEVIAEWEVDRFVALAALAHLTDVDDDSARVAADGRWGAAELLDGLPLVQYSSAGTFQLHDLWRRALVDTAAWPAVHDTAPGRAGVAAALRRLATSRRVAGDVVGAAELFAVAGDCEGVTESALAFAELSFTDVCAADVSRVAAAASSALGDGLVSELLTCARSIPESDERRAAEAFEEIARRAAAAGAPAIEALALLHAVNMRWVLDYFELPPWLVERADALAADHPMARMAASITQFHEAALAGDPRRAMLVLQTYPPTLGSRGRVSYSFGMCELGRPEQVAALEPGHELRLEIAAAMWLRGDVSPELALEIGAPVHELAAAGGFAHLDVQASAVFAVIGLAAGDPVAARRFADLAAGRAQASASRGVRAFAGLVDALCLVGERGEEAASARLAEVLEGLPIIRWPALPYVFALPSIYVLEPGVRPVLDTCEFGPAITAVLDAARALVALREHADPEPAGRLAWDRPDLLRAHVLPVHLAALAAAAGAAGHGSVGRLLDVLPGAREHLVAAADVAHAPTARWAAAQVAARPRRPDSDLHLDLLGPVGLRRGVTVVVDPDWVRRDRVRQLLAYLALHRRVTRRAVTDALWPALDPAKAAANLRVNLTHLQRVLQPDRLPDEPPWFVRADGEWLVLATDGLIVDADRFDELHRRARTLDDQGRTVEALATFREALALVRGAYLDGWPQAVWADSERLRLRALVTGARCRAGELLLALGEPEQAAAQAVEVLADEPLQERSGRLLAHAIAAQGDRATARRVVAELLERLSAVGLDPEPDTTSLARRHGLAADVVRPHARSSPATSV